MVPNRLGCINHTLLTLEALRQRGIDIMGIILNDIDGRPAQVKDLNKRYFEERLGSLYWGEFPFSAPVRDFVEILPQLMMGAPVLPDRIETVRASLAAGMQSLKKEERKLLETG
jgi:hypothetical protein